jgi:C-terminal processing protease CtpA/Prc
VPYPPGGVFAFTEKIEGEAVVTWSSLAGEAVGLTRGAVIPSVGGGRARYSLGTLTRLDGTLLEGNGVVPDVAVEWTIEDVRHDRDPDVETAEGLILER